MSRLVALALLALAVGTVRGQDRNGAESFVAMPARAAREAADNSFGFRVLISVEQRRLWVVTASDDTVRSAPVAVGSDRTLLAWLRRWTFSTPTGVTYVLAKEADPQWIPPDWHYVEVARKHDLDVAYLTATDAVPLSGRRLLLVRGGAAGLVDSTGRFTELPVEEEIVFDGTLFIPPFGTRNRSVAGALGPYRLQLGDGIGLHGTPDQSSIGEPVTHGCIRLHDEDVTWLYENVPVGTMVVIY